MALKLVTPPAPVISVYTAKRHLQYMDNDQDELIEALVAAATGHIDGKDGWLKRSLKPQTYDLIYDRFPCGPGCGGDIEIPLPPLISIDTINYVDVDGVNQTLLADNYIVDNVSQPGWVQIGSAFSWPAVMNTINAVRVRFTAGYPDDSAGETTVPHPVRHAILMMVGDLFAHRESVLDGNISAIPIPSTVKALLAPFRIFA